MPCGDVTVFGACDGNTLSYCAPSTNQLVTIDCTMYIPNSVCSLINNQYGYDCAVPNGSQCLFVDQNMELFPALCSTMGSGCVIDIEPPDGGAGSACVGSLGNCTDPGDGGFQASCNGNNAVVACNIDQPIAFDCKSSTCTNGQCVSQAGGPCSPGETSSFVCATGLTCMVPDGGQGTCQ